MATAFAVAAAFADLVLLESFAFASLAVFFFGSAFADLAAAVVLLALAGSLALLSLALASLALAAVELLGDDAVCASTRGPSASRHIAKPVMSAMRA